MNRAVSHIAAAASSTLQDTIETVTSLPHDIVIIAGLFLFFTLFAFMAGKGKMLSFIVAFYIAALLSTVFPAITFIQKVPISIAFAQSGLFLFVTALSFFALRGAFRLQYPYGAIGNMLEVLMLGSSATAITLAISQNIVHLSEFYTFAPAIRFFFTQESVVFGVFLAPLIFFAILSRDQKID